MKPYTDAELEALEEMDRQEMARRNCEHEKCYPTEWHWNGRPRVMFCDECQQANYLEMCDEKF